MRIRILFILLIAALPAMAQQKRSVANDRFGNQIGDAVPVLYRDYDAIRRNVYACMDDKKQSTPICKSVQEKMSYALYDALSQAHLFNAIAKPGESKFCDKYGQELIIGQKLGPAAAYSMMIIEEQLKYGSSLYGGDLQETFIGKIAYDYLVASQPCK